MSARRRRSASSADRGLSSRWRRAQGRRVRRLISAGSPQRRRRLLRAFRRQAARMIWMERNRVSDQPPAGSGTADAAGLPVPREPGLGADSSEDTEEVCVVCQGPLPPAKRGPRRLTCSARCRQLKHTRSQGVAPRHQAPPHGVTRYLSDGCRCSECLAAVAAKNRARRAELRGKPVPETTAHGLYVYQVYGCRCSVCSGAKSAEKERNAARPRRRDRRDG